MLAAIQDFKKSNLKSTETKVHTVDGRVYSEKKDDSGRTVVTQLDTGQQGFIGDVREDLQVGAVLPGLIIGSQDVAHNAELLEKHSVTHVLNAASFVDNIFSDKLTYKNFNIYDRPETDITVYFDEAHTFIEKGRKSGCVLVHCNAGVSRAATLVISYLMKFNKMNFQEAYDYLKEKRPAIRPNDGFVHQLKQYEIHLKEHTK
ncbi:hypothetical protein SNE40_023045 [Patella caerulea]|uniref:protein-serine/threonine phosphatase n=1 Tax=Patella caerulea TaxID=87958 RepID=A0AAN8IVN9_PATCE